MDKNDKIKHLESLMNKVERLRCNERDIENLRGLIYAELSIEENNENSNVLYIKDLKQTIKKQLEPLLDSRKDPKNRIDEMNECKHHFKRDVKEEKSRVEFR